MAKRTSKTKNKNKNNIKNFALKVFIVLLAVLIAGYLIISTLQKEFNPAKWSLTGTSTEQQGGDLSTPDDERQDSDTTTPDKGQTADKDSGLLAPSEHESNGVTFKAVSIPVEFYNYYGVSEEAENAFTLTVSAIPDGADLTGGIFLTEFKDPDSTWATGKVLPSYLQCEQIDSKNAIITCLKPFDEQILVKYDIVAEIDGQLTPIVAEYPVDYAKHVVSVEGYFEDISGNSVTGAKPNYSSDIETTNNVIDLSSMQMLSSKVKRIPPVFYGTINYSEGTVEDTFTVENISFGFTDEFKAACKSNGCNISERSFGLQSAKGNETADFTIEGVSGYFDLLFGENILNSFMTRRLHTSITQIEEANTTAPVGVFVLTFDLVGERSTFNGKILFGIDYSGFYPASTDLTGVEFQKN